MRSLFLVSSALLRGKARCKTQVKMGWIFDEHMGTPFWWAPPWEQSLRAPRQRCPVKRAKAQENNLYNSTPLHYDDARFTHVKLVLQVDQLPTVTKQYTYDQTFLAGLWAWASQSNPEAGVCTPRLAGPPAAPSASRRGDCRP